MTPEHKLAKILKVLDLQLTHSEARLAQEQSRNSELRRRQLAIVEQCENIASTAAETCAANPSVFAHQQSRIKKLERDLRALQPELAHAAIDRLSAEDRVKTALRIRIGVQQQLAKLDDESIQRPSEMEQLASLFANAKGLS